MDSYASAIRCYPAIMRTFSLFIAAVLLAPLAHARDLVHVYPEARPFTVAPTPRTAVKAAFARAKAERKLVILVFGFDACHDSRALAGWFESPRFAAMLKARYEVVWIDVGRNRKRNRPLAQRYGVAPIVGTPTVLVLDAQARPLNLADAVSWRNAASRNGDHIFDYFAGLGT